MYNSIESGNPSRNSCISGEGLVRRPFILILDFRLGVGIRNFNHVNEFVSISEI